MTSITYYAFPGIIDTKFIPANMTQEIRLQYGKQIIETVARFYGVELDNVYSKKRGHDLTTACQVSTYFIKSKMPSLDLISIAKLFGNRYACRSGYNFDHSAIIYNKAKIDGFIKVRDRITEDLETIKNLI